MAEEGDRLSVVVAARRRRRPGRRCIPAAAPETRAEAVSPDPAAGQPRRLAKLTSVDCQPAAVGMRERQGFITSGNVSVDRAGSSSADATTIDAGTGTPRRVAVRNRSTLSAARSTTSAGANGTAHSGSKRCRLPVTRNVVTSETGRITSTRRRPTVSTSAATNASDSVNGSGYDDPLGAIARRLGERRRPLLSDEHFMPASAQRARDCQRRTIAAVGHQDPHDIPRSRPRAIIAGPDDARPATGRIRPGTRRPTRLR